MPAILTTEMFPTESAISNKAEDPAAEATVREAAEHPPGSEPRPFQSHGPAEQVRSRLRRALGILVCLEVGIFLFVAPWSPLWTGYLQLGYDPAWLPIVESPFVRGAISGVGLLNLWFAFRGVWDFRDAGIREQGVGSKE
jgi:hypothetical protein